MLPRETAGRPCPGCRPTSRGRRSRAAGRGGLAFPGGSTVLGRGPPSPCKRPGLSAQRRRSRAAEGSSSAFLGGSQASGRLGPVLGPTRSSAGRTPTGPRFSSAARRGRPRPSLRGSATPLWGPGDFWRRSSVGLGSCRGPGASSLPAPVGTTVTAAAHAPARADGLGPTPALPGFAGAGLEGWTEPTGWSRLGRRAPGGACWGAPAGVCA